MVRVSSCASQFGCCHVRTAVYVPLATRLFEVSVPAQRQVRLTPSPAARRADWRTVSAPCRMENRMVPATGAVAARSTLSATPSWFVGLITERDNERVGVDGWTTVKDTGADASLTPVVPSSAVAVSVWEPAANPSYDSSQLPLTSAVESKRGPPLSSTCTTAPAGADPLTPTSAPGPTHSVLPAEGASIVGACVAAADPAPIARTVPLSTPTASTRDVPRTSFMVDLPNWLTTLSAATRTPLRQATGS